MATIDKIDNLDKKILKILSQNARIPFKDVATECNVSRAAIHQRVQHLIEANVIMGSGFDVNPKSLGYSTCTYVGITLERGSMYKDVVECLQHIPEIVECHLCICSTDVCRTFLEWLPPKRLSRSNRASSVKSLLVLKINL